MGNIVVRCVGFIHLGLEGHHCFINKSNLNQQYRQSLLLEAVLLFPKALGAQRIERHGMRSNAVPEGLTDMGLLSAHCCCLKENSLKQVLCG